MRNRQRECNLQNIFHRGIPRSKPHPVIKKSGIFISFPDVQRDLITADPPGFFLYEFEKTAGDMLSAQVLIHAKIINIERPELDHIFAVRLMFDGTKCVTQYKIIFIGCHIDRPGIIVNDLNQFFFCIFCRSRNKKIGPNRRVDLQDLR